jgi:hypothetical protein
MNQNDKIAFYIRYISKNPDLSGNAIYTKFKGSKYGMRKKDFYKVYRNTKSIPKPSPEKSFKAVPKKYKKKVAKQLTQERLTVKERKKRVLDVDTAEERRYVPFFEALEFMVFNKMGRYPDNLRDLEGNMARYDFRKGAWPTQDQRDIAWAYLKLKGMTSR